MKCSGIRAVVAYSPRRACNILLNACILWYAQVRVGRLDRIREAVKIFPKAELLRDEIIMSA